MHSLYLIGATGSGKSTMLRALCQKCSDDGVNYGSLEVGKRMRAKYDVSYFNGSMAPTHTEPEVISMYEEEYDRHKNTAALFIVDGQPRTVRQLKATVAKDAVNSHILHLYASHEVRAWRINARDNGLSSYNQSRLNNDSSMLYELLSFGQLFAPTLFMRNYHVYDTGDAAFNVEECAMKVLNSVLNE